MISFFLFRLSHSNSRNHLFGISITESGAFCVCLRQRTQSAEIIVDVLHLINSSALQPLTDAIAREGLRHGAQNLLHAYTDGSNIEARYEDLHPCILYL